MRAGWTLWAKGEIVRFRDDARGVTAILFAAIALPLLGLGLAAIDYARAQGVKSAIQDAADSAARAGAAMLGGPHGEIEDAVRGYLKTNLPTNRSELPFSLTFGPDDTSLTVKMKTNVPATMLNIVGVKHFDVAIESTAERPVLLPVASPPHRGVTPELPPDIGRQLSQFGREVSAEDLKRAEEIARQLLQEVERTGGADVQQLLRSLGAHR